MADVIYRVGDGALTLLADQTTPVFIENGDEANIEVWVSRPGVIAQAGAPAPSATAPEAFTAGQWSINAVGEVTITALPSDGGSAITDIQYRVDTGSGFGAAVSFGDTATGTYATTAEEGDDVQIMAINAEGAADWSDTKDVPEAIAPGGPVAAVQVKTNNNTSQVTTISATFDATPTEGNILVAVLVSGGASASNAILASDQVPEGWQRLAPIADPMPTAAPQFAVWQKVAGESESATFSLSDLESRRHRLALLELPNEYGSGVTEIIGGEPVIVASGNEITFTPSGDVPLGAMALAVAFGSGTGPWGEWSGPDWNKLAENGSTNSFHATYSVAARYMAATEAVSTGITIEETGRPLNGVVMAFTAAE